MIWWVLFGVFLIALAWFFWAPIRLEIDSESGIFIVQWRGICRLQWVPAEGVDQLQLTLFFIQRKIRLGSASGAQKPEIPAKKPRSKKPVSRKKIRIQTMWRLFRNLLRTFEVKRFHLVWDSDDFIWNARWYPLAWHLSTLGKGLVEINFSGRRELALIVENRLGRITWAVFKTFITKN
ncbi:MAG: hypothetical protein IPK76_02815 [Lewinellaceae bacterium]|nr:hypothetical protein [Lewinellaceae bacterium]